jgi:hypothetical protein
MVKTVGEPRTVVSATVRLAADALDTRHVKLRTSWSAFALDVVTKFEHVASTVTALVTPPTSPS